MFNACSVPISKSGRASNVTKSSREKYQVLC